MILSDQTLIVSPLTKKCETKNLDIHLYDKLRISAEVLSGRYALF